MMRCGNLPTHASSSPPHALRTRSAHATREMLEMPDGITQETTVSILRHGDDPAQRAVGRRMTCQRRLCSIQIRHPGLVQLQDGLGRLPIEPEGLRIGECGQVKCFSFIRVLPRGLWSQLRRNPWQPRAGSIYDRWHLAGQLAGTLPGRQGGFN